MFYSIVPSLGGFALLPTLHMELASVCGYIIHMLILLLFVYGMYRLTTGQRDTWKI